MSRLKLKLLSYRRPFLQPLQTSRGSWGVREGVLLRIEAEGATPMAPLESQVGVVSLRAYRQFGYGEVAPLPAFGTESLAEAESILSALETTPTAEWPTIDHLAKIAPATAFGLASAFCFLSEKPGSDTAWLTPPVEPSATRSRAAGLSHTGIACAGLLPAGPRALEVLEALLAAGFETFKWKVGALPFVEERRVAARLFQQLHGKGILRLDANAAFTADETAQWLAFLQNYPVEFFEQPMAVGCEAEMAVLAERYGVAIALDESVGSPAAAAAMQARFPRGPFVLKPAIGGPPGGWLDWQRRAPVSRTVYSSVFETSIGFDAVLRLALADPHSCEAAGFGTLQAFGQDDFLLHQPGPLIRPLEHPEVDCAYLWKQTARS